jgi:hypothetical protein
MDNADSQAAPDFTSDTEIRAMLRGATRARILAGWCPYNWGGETFWVVSPPHAKPSTYPTDEAVHYCRMLLAAGVEPLYRTA